MPSRVLALVAERLRAFRNAGGFSQEEMAEKIDCSIPTYRCLEQATPDPHHLPDPKLSTLMRVLHTLELDEALLDTLKGIDSTERPLDGEAG
ncbi:helix-turn-helix transcriptional regulator [Microbacterium sp. NPDC028030]|uniref:helix-turn-helix domain-containing protein n=1 Tax=Microbacterium sp. NPDC028030 TaxID=3155124 RepID=UPI0033C60D2A